MKLKLKKKSLIMSVVISILMMFLFTGCGTNYGHLSPEEKEDINRLYTNKSIWESDDCDSISFQYQDGKKVFCVKELDRHYSNPATDQYSFNYYFYTFDNSLKMIGSDWKSGVYYSFGTGDRYTYSPEWKADWTEDEQKEYLAKMYTQAFND